MNKKLKQKMGVVFIGAMMVANVGMASPITDYSESKVGLDLTVATKNDFKVTNKVAGEKDLSYKLDGKSTNWEYNLMVGVAEGWGIQYRNFSPESQMTAVTALDGINAGYKVKFNEFNVIKTFSKNIAGFVGYHQANGTLSITDFGSVKSSNKNVLQFGIIGKTPLSNNTDLYGVVALGKDLYSYEAGLSQTIGKNMQFTISYREKQVKNLEMYEEAAGSFNNDIKVSGINYGISWKI